MRPAGHAGESPALWTSTFPAELPISQRRDDIAAAIRDHQVVVVAGETGSGKTTQLPKICLELGRGAGGRGGLIGHTQPRRIAARSVAERIASELKTELGDEVGYQVRFTDRTSPDSRIKVMTDGILLAELQRDRQLRRYDTIIIDEAHERSLNIDFLLGYLKRLLPRRPDLKLVITSATIDPERFAAPLRRPRDGTPGADHRGLRADLPGRDPLPPAVIDGSPDEESTRRARRVVRDQTEAIVDAVRELSAEGPATSWCSCRASGRSATPPTRSPTSKPDRGRTLEIVPLFSRLSAAEQHRVFSSHPPTVRRVVLATNVAETSLTVPGIRYVVDTGVARISRYSLKTKVQRLPIEAISQASAQQRSGRCGRVEAGIAIRLYSEEDFEGRPGVHRPRDPAHQPGLGDPPDDLARARRRRPVPVRRAARPPQRRPPACSCSRSSGRWSRRLDRRGAGALTRVGRRPRPAADRPPARAG